MVRKTIRCNACSHNPTRLFDIIITDDKHIWVETKCKKDGIVTTDITETVKDLMLYLMQEDQKSA